MPKARTVRLAAGLAEIGFFFFHKFSLLLSFLNLSSLNAVEADRTAFGTVVPIVGHSLFEAF